MILLPQSHGRAVEFQLRIALTRDARRARKREALQCERRMSDGRAATDTLTVLFSQGGGTGRRYSLRRSLSLLATVLCVDGLTLPRSRQA
jgi:hypothetical protein